MPSPTPRHLERPLAQLKVLFAGAVEYERAYAAEIDKIEPSYRNSARNLLHYLSIRQHDIRDLQQDLSALGLSSLGILEPHALASVESVIAILEKLSGQASSIRGEPPVDFRTGPLLLRDHTRALLGPEPPDRQVRIMVTMPSEAAHNAQLVQDLLLAGMDVMRINCAHDGPAEWAAMVDNLRQAERVVGRHCRVQADLAGPKLRTGKIQSSGRVKRIAPRRDVFGRVDWPGRLWLTSSETPEPSPLQKVTALQVTGNLLADLILEDRLVLMDARGLERTLIVTQTTGNSVLVDVNRTTYIEEAASITALRNETVIGSATIVGVPEVIKPIELWPGDLLLLTRAAESGCAAVYDESGQVIEPARIHCTLDIAFEQVEAGQSVWFDDGKIGGIVQENDGSVIRVKITQTGPQGSKLRSEKGINFPDTEWCMSALTSKDQGDLAEVVRYVDMVALSFVRGPNDIEQLHDELDRLQANHLGVVIKIENRQAFENLPQILLTSLHSPPVGVMIARGDLAVEVGFARLSEVQQEILWLCEAAHVPVIWATQILEGMAKKGAPSRAEVSDAAMSIMAECAMLNKGPNIVSTVRFLDSVIGRMDEHYVKRRATLRKLSVAQLKLG